MSSSTNVDFISRLAKLMHETEYHSPSEDSTQTEFQLAAKHDPGAVYSFHTRRLYGVDDAISVAALQRFEGGPIDFLTGRSEEKSAEDVLTKEMESFGLSQLLEDVKSGAIVLNPWPANINKTAFEQGEPSSTEGMEIYLKELAATYVSEINSKPRSPITAFWLSHYNLTQESLLEMSQMASSMVPDYAPEDEQVVRNVGYMLTGLDASQAREYEDVMEANLAAMSAQYDLSKLMREHSGLNSVEESDSFMGVLNGMPHHARMLLMYSNLYVALCGAVQDVERREHNNPPTLQIGDICLKLAIKAMVSDTLFQMGLIERKAEAPGIFKKDLPDARSGGDADSVSICPSDYQASPVLHTATASLRRHSRRLSIFSKKYGVSDVDVQTGMPPDFTSKKLQKVLDYLRFKQDDYDPGTKDYDILTQKYNIVSEVTSRVGAGDMTLDAAIDGLLINDTLRIRRNRFDCFHTPRTIRLLEAKDLDAVNKLLPEAIRDLPFDEPAREPEMS